MRRWIILMLLLARCSSAVTTPGATSPPAETETPTETAAPTAAPTVTPPATPSPRSGRPLLMAHTMTWYETPEVSGVWGWHWTMNHFNPGRETAEGRREIASYVYPLTGPYDSADPAVLEYQTLLMKVSGIDGVIVDWYGTEDFWDYAGIHEATLALFEAAQRAGLSFAVCYEDQTVKHMVENDHLPVGEVYDHGQEVMHYLADTWFGEEIYLKTGEQPVLLVFGPQYFTSAADWDQLFTGLDPHPALVTLDGHTETAGVGSFPWPPMWKSRDGVLSLDAAVAYLESFYNKAEAYDYLVAGAFPGFHDIYEEAGVAAETRYLDPHGGETFETTLQMALDQNPDVVQLITWNDYGETTTIEPTEEYGYQYLEMVQAARRAAEPDFPYTAGDLRLPLRLYELREAHAGDVEVNAHLDAAFEAMIAGDVDEARAVLE